MLISCSVMVNKHRNTSTERNGLVHLAQPHQRFPRALRCWHRTFSPCGDTRVLFMIKPRERTPGQMFLIAICSPVLKTCQRPDRLAGTRILFGADGLSPFLFTIKLSQFISCGREAIRKRTGEYQAKSQCLKSRAPKTTSCGQRRYKAVPLNR